ncbi:MAG: sulfatase-like hydrolase/transferase, partial [Rhodospirillaceae bacterium]|nr:sulfatase-like hydrolase/transferase [Rhodospirillaceae bacterium]
ADNGGLRGGGFHEGAIRVPFVASWPSRWPSGSTFQHTASTLDIAATILAAAGATPSASHPALDGVNLDPFLRGERTDAPHDALFWRRSTTGGYAVRRGNMKLVRNRRGDPPALFDLAADPGETVNRLAGDTETANEIAALWNAWNADNADGNLYTAADTYETRRRQYFEDYEAERLRDAQHRTMRIEAFEEPGEAGEATLGVAAGVRPVTTGTEPLPPPVNPPNVIVITADDLGYADLGFTGATEISTPGIDRLAREGVVFPNAYTPHTVCSPSRAALITGRHGARFRLESNLAFEPFDENQGLTTSETTVARHLQTVGYRTGIIGKWHLGGSQPFNPRQRGFGTFFGFLGGGHWYWSTDAGKAGTEYSAPLIDDVASHHLDGAYLTSALSDRAVDFVQAVRDRPFFLYLAYNAPHTPLEAPASVVAKYDHVANRNRRTYLAMVDTLDTGVGLLLETLEREGLRDNTLIFFLSDHGAPARGPGDNGAFSGGKASLSEGGVRVPFVASWPARWPQAATFDPIVSSLDIAATAMAMASASIGDAEPLDGANLDPFVRGERTDVPHEALFWRKSGSGSYAVRSGDMKLVKDGGEPRLYNLASDPGETNDLLPGNTDIANRLATLWNAWNEHNLDGSTSIGMGNYADRRNERLVEIAAETRDGAVAQRFEIEAFEGPAAATTDVVPPNVAETHANGMADNRYPTGLWSDSEMRPTADAHATHVFPYARPGLDTPGSAGGRLDIVLENRVAATPTGGGLPAAIPDAMLRARIAAALREPPGAVAGERDLAALRVLNLSDAGIRDLSGLDLAVNLTGLDLSGNPLADLRILQALPSLEVLKLDGIAIDPWQLAPLTSLRRLSLSDNGLYDVAALAPLTQLVALDIGNNEVADLYPLVGLTRLEELRADRNRITDLAALSSLLRLVVLDIGNNEVADLYPLVGLTRLKELRADGNGITDCSALSYPALRCWTSVTTTRSCRAK